MAAAKGPRHLRRLGKHPSHPFERPNKYVDFLARAVKGKRRADRRGDSKAIHDRLRAVLTRPYCDPLAVEDLGDVVRVDALDVEGGDPRSGGGP